MRDVELLVLPLREVGAVPRRLAKGLRAVEAAESTTDTPQRHARQCPVALKTLLHENSSIIALIV